MDRFRMAFDGIEDPRTGNRLEQDLQEVLFIALCASLCGAESCVDMADFAEAKEEILRAEIDAINERVYTTVNNGVYRCGFAKSQEAYEEAFHKLFASLDYLDNLLGERRYLCGGRITEADWRLYLTLARFDAAYYGNFKCNNQHIYEYPNLGNYLRELYQRPGIAEITDIPAIKAGYYSAGAVNPTGIVPLGPGNLHLNDPHNRDRLPKAA